MSSGSRLEDMDARLRHLATEFEFPPTPDIASAVGRRLRAEAAAMPANGRPPVIGRSMRRSLLLAAALALLVVGAAFAVRFGLELLSIESAPIPTSTSGAGLDLGRELTLDDARAASGFDILVPQVLGEPDAVFVGGAALRGQVAFVYRPRNGVPAAELLRGAGLLVTQNPGEPDPGLAHKIVDTTRATVEQVDVDGAPGVWISGEPHIFWYFAQDGSVIQESRRLVGDTLAWERDGVLYRIEGEIPLDKALEIARSMR